MDAGMPRTARRRAVRRDAILNREKVLTIAARMIGERGDSVPMAEIAASAGVGVGTLYRSFPNRAALVQALQERAYELLLEVLERLNSSDLTGADAIEGYLLECVRLDERLVLPLRGADPLTDADALKARALIYGGVEEMVNCGRADKSVRGDLTALDVIACGAMIGLPLPSEPRWADAATRHVRIFVRGIRQ
jgi:AcrR family transcriptional regulator